MYIIVKILKPRDKKKIFKRIIEKLRIRYRETIIHGEKMRKPEENRKIFLSAKRKKKKRIFFIQ